MAGVDGAGGSLALAELIDGHGGELAHDFQAHYGLDLFGIVRDLCSGDARWRPGLVLVLVEQLPDDGAFAAAQLGGRDHRGWGMDRHLRALQFDALQMNTFVTARAGGAKKSKAPAAFPRPGSRSKAAGVPITALLAKAIPKSGSDLR